jgi:hypothetical protein
MAGDGARGVGPGKSRTIKDAPSLLALAHPTRLALMEAVGLAGTLTAASEVVGWCRSASAQR